MNNFWTLVKLHINVNFGISALKHRFQREKKKILESILILLAIMVGLGSFLVLYIGLLIGIHQAGKIFSEAEIILTFAFLSAQLMVFFFGFFYILSVFYFSEDMDILIPLPIKPAEVLAAKFTTVLINEYLLVIPMILPALIIYARSNSMGILYWIKGILLMLISPIFPLALVSFFTISLMRFAPIKKGRDSMVVMVSLLGLFFALAINFFVQKMPEGNETEFIGGIIEGNRGLFETLGKRFPPSLWPSLALKEKGLIGIKYFLFLLVLSSLLLLILYLMGEKMFYRGYLAGSESPSKKKSPNKKLLKKENKKQSPLRALFWREWRIFIRTPIYATNGLAGLIVAPLLILMPLITQGENMKELIEYSDMSEHSLIVSLIILSIIFLVTGINTIASTSISREGGLLWFLKMLPVKTEDIINAKLIHSSSINIVGILIILTAAHFILATSLMRLVALFIIAFLLTLLNSIIGLLIDVIRPKLEWKDPQEAIKQNLNVLFSMLVTLILIISFAGLSVLFIIINLSDFLVLFLIGLISLGLIIPSLLLLYKTANKKLNSMDL